MSDKSRLITLKKVDFSEIDFSILIAEANRNIPFEIKRVYWLTAGEQAAERGNHAHLNSTQVVIAVRGTIEVKLSDIHRSVKAYTLADDSTALFIPSNHWIDIIMPPHSILLCLSSHLYDDQVTVYNPEDFFS